MLRPALLAVALASAAAPAADPAPRFKWAANDTLTYKVAQNTAVRETLPDAKTGKPTTTEARTTLTLTKKWAVKAVDPTGVGTLEMTITAMRNEFRKPDGSAVVRDSADPADAKEMAGFLNVPVVTVRVDPRGRLVEVKEAKAGSAARLQAELPFRMTLPDASPTATPLKAWDRTFAFKLDPPLGTGESYEFRQSFAATGVKDGLLAATVETTLKDPPKALAERVPLVPMLWAGEVFFDPAGGRYHAARLKAKADLPNHQGEGTRFEYESTYAEDFAK